MVELVVKHCEHRTQCCSSCGKKSSWRSIRDPQVDILISMRQSGVRAAAAAAHSGGFCTAHCCGGICSILIACNHRAIQMQTVNHRQIVTKHVVSAEQPLPCVWGSRRKVFLIVWRVRGSGSNITHDQIRVVFRELLAGYLSWLNIPLLSLGLCVGMIRSWRLEEEVCDVWWGD